MFDYIYNGVPNTPAPGSPALAADVANGRVYVSTTSGWTDVSRGVVVAQAANGAITNNTSAAIVITKTGSLAALTLAAPTVGGIYLDITSDTAFAHTITATALIQNGVTGGAKTTITFAAFPGSSISLVSTPSLKWNVLSTNVITSIV